MSGDADDLGGWDADLEPEPEYLRDRLFFDFADPGGLPAGGTLAGATGLAAADPPYPTSLVRDGETAWRTPFPDLTCEQARLMLEQRMGIAVLARPILSFIARCPQALVSNYPAEMELMALIAADEFLRHEPAAFRAWLAGDFSWMDGAFSCSRSLRREAEAALAAARRLAGIR